MKPVFIDTSHLLALVNVDDPFHDVAIAWDQAVRSPLVTTEYILIEFADGLANTRTRMLARRGIDFLRNNLRVTVLPASTTLMDAGLDLYSDRKDKHWELTDCISFTVMQARDICDALTLDRHFEQAGYRALLRLPAPQP